MFFFLVNFTKNRSKLMRFRQKKDFAEKSEFFSSEKLRKNPVFGKSKMPTVRRIGAACGIEME